MTDSDELITTLIAVFLTILTIGLGAFVLTLGIGGAVVLLGL